jgi:hypothetical protein
MEKPGSKRNKNGRKIYSQTASAIRQRKLKGLGEFAEGAAAEPLQPALVETPQEPISSPGEVSTESIGVVTTVTVPDEVPLAPHTESDQQNYFCENCKGPVSITDTQCDTCEESLDWSGLR